MRTPRRADLAELPSRDAILRRWEELEWWSCAYCDRPFGEKVVAEVDHIRPLAKGGRDEWVNFNPACRECNRGKGDLDVDDWISMSAGQREAEGDLSITEGH
ncbi:HNH endonuclease [Streptomyces sp. R44]|uniref:HNH endonuclease n=1 Tax=Streptomyces sp. R44 TaxID=3238633 RepID=A0AB39T7K6_9ACTN